MSWRAAKIRAPEWGSGGRGFKSRRPDLVKVVVSQSSVGRVRYDPGTPELGVPGVFSRRPSGHLAASREPSRLHARRAACFAARPDRYRCSVRWTPRCAARSGRPTARSAVPHGSPTGPWQLRGSRARPVWSDITPATPCCRAPSFRESRERVWRRPTSRRPAVAAPDGSDRSRARLPTDVAAPAQCRGTASSASI
jgi:hypothetical protein